MEQAAFDPSVTDPHQEKEKAGEGNSVSLIFRGLFKNGEGRPFLRNISLLSCLYLNEIGSMRLSTRSVADTLPAGFR